MSKIIYITGGERSGKSSYAQQLALQKSSNPVYLATAQRVDEDFEARIARHKADRGDEWELVEEPVELSKLSLENRCVLLDCVTLWLNNIFFLNNKDIEISMQKAQSEWSEFIRQPMELIVVSNEIGMGVHATTPMARKFVELQGWMNQYIAKHADEAWMVVSGIPVKIKG